MSLETALFIKDLVATNPQGTDPKSQGDDHLRLIKGVLQSQFSGFTEGVAITRTESDLNAILTGKRAELYPLAAVDAVPTAIGWFGLTALPTGTAPPNGFAIGDIIHQLVYSPTRAAQVYYELSHANHPNVWVRRWNGTAWTPWQPLFESTQRQTYSFGTNYTAGNSAAYRRLNRIVYLEGMIVKNAPIVSGDIIATLALGFRPDFLQQVTVLSVSGNLATQLMNVELRTNGQIAVAAIISSSGTPSGTSTFPLAAAFVGAQL